MILENKERDIYLEIVKLIEEFEINRNKIFLLKFSDITMKTKCAKRLEKAKRGLYYDYLSRRLSYSDIDLNNYNEYDFIRDIINISDIKGKTLLVDNVEPLFAIWSEKNFINLYQFLDLAMSKHVIVIFTYYFPIKANVSRLERLKIIG